LRDLYDRAAVVVVPVIETTFPAGITTLLEAMSMGKAVIATGTSGLGCVVPDDVAVIVPPGDADALASAVSALLSDPNKRRMLGERAQQFVRSKLTLDRYAGGLVTILSDCGSTQSAIF
jgi:glycosyltransferase involved in cell wall biosynthesis